MARELPFRLKMKNGTEVRTIEELQANFDMETVLVNYENGKLTSWFRRRHYHSIADLLDSLNKSADDFYIQLCNVLGVEYQGQYTSLSELQYQQEKRQRFQELECYDRYIDKFDQAAMNQQDLEILLKQGVTEIYLFQNHFEIPLSYEGVTYNGVGDPIVIIRAEDNVNFKAKNLKFKDAVFGWDVSGISEADEVFRAEQMLMKNDWRNALPILKKHAENNHPRAILLLERIYCSYTPQNDCRLYYGKKGEEIGSVQSHIIGADGRVEKYIPVLRKIAENGNPLDECLCGYAFWQDGYSNDQNFDTEMIFHYLESAAAKGSLWAESIIGYCFYYGNGVCQDYNEAIKHYRNAAERGYAHAQFFLYEYYSKKAESEKVIPLDDSVKMIALAARLSGQYQRYYDEAEKWNRAAIEQGYIKIPEILKEQQDDIFGILGGSSSGSERNLSANSDVLKLRRPSMLEKLLNKDLF